MEVPDVGENCSNKSCNRLDFLPFTCEQCHKVFCQDHRFPEHHNCDGESDQVPKPEKELAELRPFTCSLTGCERREAAEVKCPQCGGQFCLQHRHQVDHKCPALQQKSKVGSGGGHHLRMPKPAAKDPRLGGPPGRLPQLLERDGKKNSTAAKVMMLRLKMKAEGLDSVPVSERVYYEVHPPLKSGLTSKPMFFSSKWSVGKVVDVIAGKFKLCNENNQLDTKHKLVLLNPQGATMEMSRPLHSVLDELPQGGVARLEYEPPAT